ncbi:ADP-ribose pyrophosphatase [Rhodopseudomonas thermotolerans]|jgi:ADP-ribose pyrophosphatase|uniref:ADP-ribose pyrophosphatase n=2 Tax=Rhodopseudomonas TaxID=1073 RepID=A0A336JRD8_9BRAD|nr:MULTISPECIES: NUDIX hydrolase [Rhodopseudomonas]RED30597.1 ADP-ribose pyrophosphatase [Rhodopseudomonas pentothenatexigens]REF92701.1 ADP-ribose pyrophosphatase [Rhodopseudomonas thermotolerans]SSW92130.1 ADP-ribose pyrophosphatase [Rhodopseudomonas pentothenatexigens]
MSERDGIDQLADREANVILSPPETIGRGFMAYERYEVSLRRDGEPPLLQQRDVLRASKVAAVIPVDLARDAVVLIRQFRLPAHLATGRGDMVEIVAGRVDPHETATEAARRECIEEIGVAPDRVVELYSVLPTPGITDEQIVFFVGHVDSSSVLQRAGLAEEDEDTEPFVVSIEDALAALDRGAFANALLVSAMQWLALNRARLQEYFSRAA